MEAALADSDCSQQSFDELARPYEAYLETLRPGERDHLQCRLGEFIRIRDAIYRATT